MNRIMTQHGASRDAKFKAERPPMENSRARESLNPFARNATRHHGERWTRIVGSVVPSVEFSLASLVFGLLGVAMWYAWQIQW